MTSALRQLVLVLGQLEVVAGREVWGRKMRVTLSQPFTQPWIKDSTGLILPALYGLGHSEEVVARALQGRMSRRPYVFTKCERVWDINRKVGASLKAASIRRECEDSLRRLKTEAIDLYQIHWPEPDEDIEEGWSELARLKEVGKVRYIGVSNFSVPQMKRAQAIAPITSLQPPYSLVTREIEQEISPFREEK